MKKDLRFLSWRNQHYDSSSPDFSTNLPVLLTKKVCVCCYGEPGKNMHCRSKEHVSKFNSKSEKLINTHGGKADDKKISDYFEVHSQSIQETIQKACWGGNLPNHPWGGAPQLEKWVAPGQSGENEDWGSPRRLVRNFTPQEFQNKTFTPSFSPNFNR